MIESIKNSNNFLFLILFIVYSVIMVFLFPIKTIGFFISYLFTIVFFIVSYYVLNYIDNNYHNNNASLYTFTYIMLFIQIIISILLSLFNILFNITIIGNVLVLTIFLIGIFLLFRSIDYIDNVQEDTKIKTEFIDKVREELEIIELQSNNEQISFENIRNQIRFSNPVSNERSLMVESEILNYLSDLKNLINSDSNDKDIKDLLGIIGKKLEEREIILKHRM